MAVLRRLGIVDIQANAMSLAGIAISIGVLVDSSVVMAENVMHRLREQFGDRTVRGDVRDIVLPACLAVGRPIVFSVAIMVLSFLPVFALGGIEGKMFHPLGLHQDVRPGGRGRAGDHAGAGPVHDLHSRPAAVGDGEPADPRRDRGLSAGAVVPDGPAGRAGLGAGRDVPARASPRWAAGPSSWRPCSWRWWRRPFCARRRLTAVLAPASLLLVALVADQTMEPLAREFMTPLDEGMVMDMPITVPRASVTESVDDLKARDMVLCRFPEVDMVVGKAGRAETPTDPAPMDMIETMVNFRPREFWPRRKLRDSGRRRSRAAPSATPWSRAASSKHRQPRRPTRDLGRAGGRGRLAALRRRQPRVCLPPQPGDAPRHRRDLADLDEPHRSRGSRRLYRSGASTSRSSTTS